MATKTKVIVATILTLGFVSLMSGVAGYAIFTDQETVPNNVFGSGTIDISTAPTTALVTYSSMLPGDSVTSDIVVTNDGDSQLRYSITSSATNADSLALKDELVLTIKTIDVTTPGTACDDFDGTQLYTGDLDSGVGGLLVGDPTQGSQAGDRTLNASASETLCFRVELLSTSTGPQGASTTATFTFDSEQTANN